MPEKQWIALMLCLALIGTGAVRMRAKYADGRAGTDRADDCRNARAGRKRVCTMGGE